MRRRGWRSIRLIEADQPEHQGSSHDLRRMAWHLPWNSERVNGDPVSSQHIALQDSGLSRASMGNGVP
jgi:hypothetical protein